MSTCHFETIEIKRVPRKTWGRSSTWPFRLWKKLYVIVARTMALEGDTQEIVLLYCNVILCEWLSICCVCPLHRFLVTLGSHGRTECSLECTHLNRIALLSDTASYKEQMLAAYGFCMWSTRCSIKVFLSWNSCIDNLKTGTNKGRLMFDLVKILCFRVWREDRLYNVISSFVVKHLNLLWLSRICKQTEFCLFYCVASVEILLTLSVDYHWSNT